ncbi:unnamed protein product [Clavelina lepadiformis]|uniref:Fibrinogen C-terminal domain-containing protein n=1 Tax=Clavelina lepadiformis TaxID=159417 RepID=A0ABP0G918_CLALP
MRGLTLLLSLACYVIMVYSQQCRQVLTTVCDNDINNSTMETGDKNDVEGSRKSASIGVNQDQETILESGGVEEEMKKDSCLLEPLGAEIMTRLAKIEELILLHLDTTTATSSTVTTTTVPGITSCVTSQRNGPQSLTNGVEVYCENGWTLIQRRVDGSVNFQRGWNDYVNGFGQLNGEFWLGLDNIHEMTRGGGCRLKIALRDFKGYKRYARYSSFSVGSAQDFYPLHVSRYHGNAGNSLETFHNGSPFSTADRDNDSRDDLNCATHYGGSGGWWFGGCFYSALNGVWRRESTGFAQGIIWHAWKGYHTPLKKTKMKFRCN